MDELNEKLSDLVSKLKERAAHCDDHDDDDFMKKMIWLDLADIISSIIED